MTEYVYKDVADSFIRSCGHGAWRINTVQCSLGSLRTCVSLFKYYLSFIIYQQPTATRGRRQRWLGWFHSSMTSDVGRRMMNKDDDDGNTRRCRFNEEASYRRRQRRQRSVIENDIIKASHQHNNPSDRNDDDLPLKATMRRKGREEYSSCVSFRSYIPKKRNEPTRYIVPRSIARERMMEDIIAEEKEWCPRD